MAHRMGLVLAPASLIRASHAAIAGDARQRQQVGRALAARGVNHRLRATVSERVRAACIFTAGAPESWEFASVQLPYLLAARSAEAIGEALRTLRSLEDEDALEAFFVEQARALGAQINALDRAQFAAPDQATVAAWIEEQWQHVAEALRASTSPESEQYEAAFSTWAAFGMLWARTGPCFLQGTDRWLGDVVAGSHRTLAPAGDESAPADDEARGLAYATLRLRLGEVLRSTAELSAQWLPRDWRAHLPREGQGGMTSGAIALDRLEALQRALTAAQTARALPYANGETWAELVRAAAQCAKDEDAYLIEGDELIYGAQRWPLLE